MKGKSHYGKRVAPLNVEPGQARFGTGEPALI